MIFPVHRKNLIQKGQALICARWFLIPFLLGTSSWLGIHRVLGADHPYGNFQVLPYELLVHIAQYLDPQSLQSLMTANSHFYDLGKDPLVQKALKTKEVEGLLYQVGILKPTKLYQVVPIEEIKASAIEDREPTYLATVHKAYGIRIREFVEGLPVGENRGIRHGLNLIYFMSIACSTNWSVAWSASWYAANSSVRAAASSAVKASASASTMAIDSNRSNVQTSDIAWSAAKKVLATNQNLSPLEIGRLSYRVAEVTALLYFLKFALDDPDFEIQGIFSRIYQAMDKFLKSNGLPEDLSIWESKEAWNAFYAQHFGELTPDALAFLTPYLDEIKKTRLALNQQS
jgi:hypothetical protein